VRVKETSASKLLMRHRNISSEGIKTGAPPLSGKSMVVTYLLPMRCPVYKQRDFHLGFDRELENLIGGATPPSTGAVSGAGAARKLSRSKSVKDSMAASILKSHRRVVPR
jgi:hypothetical protein